MRTGAGAGGGDAPALRDTAGGERADTSANTHKRLTDKCTYYRVPLHRLEADAGTLGRAVGKTGAVAAVGVTDPGLLRALHLPEAGAGSADAESKST